MRIASTPTRYPNFGLTLPYAALFGFALFFFLYHLDNRLLWGDEAETALLGKNIVRFGIPKTVDGLNHITVLGNLRDENATHVWTWAPWLPEYLVAGVYSIFGQTTWSSRVAFAAIGWLSVVLLGHVVYRIYRDHRIALGSAFLLATSEVFLLHSRQCRYYSITVFAEVLLSYGAFELLSNRKRAISLLAAALILQFYTNFIVAAANFPLLIALGWFNRGQRQILRRLLFALALFALAAAPWLLYAHPWQQSGELIHENLITQALYYGTEWQFHFVPWIFLLLPLIRFFSKRRVSQTPATTTTQLEQSFAILIVGYFIVLLLPPAELRYLLPLLPVGCLLAAAWLFRYLPWPILATAILALQATTNFIAIATTLGLERKHSLRFPLIQFTRSLNETYVDRFADVRDFFAKEARPGQTVLVQDPEFPLIFYTGLKIIDVRLTTPEGMPDWILPQSASGLIAQGPITITESVKDYYEPISIRVHDSNRRGNVPHPDVYQYRTTDKMSDFLIYQKKILTLRALGK
jgi:dolichyl-phosphate-mannose-protein mannosyltransferase